MTDSNTVSSGLATLSATGWAVNDEYTTNGQDPARYRNTCVIAGDSITARSGLIQQVGATSAVVGDGANAVFTLASSAIMTGAKLNFIKGQGSEFDGKILTATNINVNSFSVPATFVGNPAAIPIWNNQIRLSERGWWTWANAYLRGKLWLLNNAGIGGDDPAGVLARLQNDVIAYGPKYAIIMIGINQIGTDSVDTTFAAIRRIIARIVKASITPIVLTVLPLHQSYATFSTITPKITQLNWLLRAYCEQNGFMCVDTFEALVDSAQTDGRAIANAIQGGADFVHTSTLGARLVGKAVAAAMSPLLLPAPTLTTTQGENFAANASNLNLINEAPWTLTGGSASGTGVSGAAATPAGFTVTSSGVTASTCVVTSAARTVGADGDAVGNNIILTMTGAEANAIFQVQLSPELAARMVAGIDYKFRFLLTLSGTTGSNLGRILATMLTTYNGTNRGYISGLETDASPPAMPYEDGTYLVESPTFRVPAGQAVNSGWFPFVQFQFLGAGTPVVAKIARVTYPRVSV